MSALAIDSSVDIMIGEETSEAASIAAEISEAVEQWLVADGEEVLVTAEGFEQDDYEWVSQETFTKECEMLGLDPSVIARLWKEELMKKDAKVKKHRNGAWMFGRFNGWKSWAYGELLSEMVPDIWRQSSYSDTWRLLSECAPPDMWQAAGSSSSDMWQWQGVAEPREVTLCRQCSQSYTQATKELRKVREILSQVVKQEATGGEVLEPWRYEFFKPWGETVNRIEVFAQDSPTFRTWWTLSSPEERHNFFNVDKRKTRTNDWFSLKSDNPPWWKKGQDFHLWWRIASPEQKDAWHRFCKTSERDHF